jgi:hypothetical protein
MIIYLNGSINSGKSTVAKLLISRISNTVHIEVDHLRNFAGCLALEEAIPFCLEDAITLTKRWVKRGFNVVVSWPISEQNHLRFVQALAETDSPFYTFTLSPQLDIVLSNRGRRMLTKWECNRIAHLHAIGIHNPSFGVVIDNSNQSPKETTDEIVTAVLRNSSTPGTF